MTCRKMDQFFIMAVSLMALMSVVEGLYCDHEDYSPCMCLENDDSSPEIFCSIRNESDIGQIREAFYRSTIEDHEQVAFEIISDSAIPANMLGGKQARQIHIYGRMSHKFPVNQLDVDSFRSADETTEELFLYDCDATKTDWSFLLDFNQLRKIFIRNCAIRNLASMPLLPSLESIYIDSSWGLEGWYLPVENVPKLVSISVVGAYQMDKDRMNRITDGIPLSLVALQLSNSKLTQIPRKVRRLTQLKSIDLSNNLIHHLSAVSLPSLSQVESVNLRGNGLQTIETNAFRGNFSSAQIDLSHNRLTRFESSVFFPVLDSMVNGKGFIYLHNNPIECDCHLAWLIRDHRSFVSHVWNGLCSDGTSFDRLDTEMFSNCP